MSSQNHLVNLDDFTIISPLSQEHPLCLDFLFSRGFWIFENIIDEVSQFMRILLGHEPANSAYPLEDDYAHYVGGTHSRRRTLSPIHGPHPSGETVLGRGVREGGNRSTVERKVGQRPSSKKLRRRICKVVWSSSSSPLPERVCCIMGSNASTWYWAGR